MSIASIVWLLPLPPFLAFALIILFTNRNKALSHSLAIGAAVLSWLGSMVVFISAVTTPNFGSTPISSVINWIPTGDNWLQIGIQIDPLSAASLFFVAWTVLMIFIYSVGYHNYGQPVGDHDKKGLQPHGATLIDEHGQKHVVPSIEPMYSRFFAFIGLFAFGMYTLVVSNNLFTLFVGWEIMGLCSYLLIGFWYQKPTARAAMIKAFLTTRVADVFMLLGIAYLYTSIGSLSYSVIFDPATLERLGSTPAIGGLFGLSAAGMIGILIFIGTIGKSAQWPLHVWLPDAMEGPTPVSAMIHAATMVSAGVYLVVRMFPLLQVGSTPGHISAAMSVLTVTGTFTAIFAATIAVAQNDIKRVLAYSTISQLGYMIAALGIGAYVAVGFHLITHAFFKALLFLGSGSVIHGVEHGVFHTGEQVDPQDMQNMGGLRRKMPITFWTFLVGGFALSGFPFITSGFWSKDEILSDAFGHGHWVVFATLSAAAFLTAFYTMRQITLTFLGKPRTESAQHAHETQWTMTVPLMILAFFALFIGWTGISESFPVIGGIIPNFMHEFIGGTLIEMPEALPFNAWPLTISLIASLGGLSLGWLIYRNQKAGAEDPLKLALGPVHTLLRNKYYFDEMYDFIFVRPAYWLADTFTNQILDRGVIDGTLHFIARVASNIGHVFRNYFDKPVVNGFGDFVGEGVKKAGRSIRIIQTGKVQQYLLMALVLAFGVMFYFVFTFFQH